MNIPRMRTLPECVAMLRELDPETDVTLTAMRRKAKRGELPVTMVGSKRLVNFDLLLELLENPERARVEEKAGTVRRVG